MDYNESEYISSVNAKWEKLSKAQSLEELKEVLNTWPVRENYIIREEEKKLESEKKEEKDEV